MSQKYFAFIDGRQLGPFELNQLVEAGVRPSTYVWCKGMPDWDRADKVEEIRDLFRHHIEEKMVVREPESSPAVEVDRKPEPSESPALRFGRIPEPVEQEADINTPPQVSMTLAILSLILCFPLTGIAAVYFAYKAQRSWNESSKYKEKSEELKKKSHEYERLAKMWLGLTVAFGLIFWTFLFSAR